MEKEKEGGGGGGDERRGRAVVHTAANVISLFPVCGHALLVFIFLVTRPSLLPAKTTGLG